MPQLPGIKRLRRELGGGIAEPTCPPGCHIRTFAAADAVAVHRLLEVGYAQGGGEVGTFNAWWAGLRNDDEFAEDLCFLAVSDEGGVVGVAQCWTSAFIKDLAVHPLYRRRGIAEALLKAVFYEFHRRGGRQVDLKVRIDNATGALQLYEKIGMREVV